MYCGRGGFAAPTRMLPLHVSCVLIVACSLACVYVHVMQLAHVAHCSLWFTIPPMWTCLSPSLRTSPSTSAPAGLLSPMSPLMDTTACTCCPRWPRRYGICSIRVVNHKWFLKKWHCVSHRKRKSAQATGGPGGPNPRLCAFALAFLSMQSPKSVVNMCFPAVYWCNRP